MAVRSSGKAPAREPAFQRLRGHRTSSPTGHRADCHHRASTLIREPQARQACYGRGHPVNSADPWTRGKPVGARERGSGRRPGNPAGVTPDEWRPPPVASPWPLGWHVAPGPRQDVGGWERLGNSGVAPGTRPTRSTNAGLNCPSSATRQEWDLRVPDTIPRAAAQHPGRTVN